MPDPDGPALVVARLRAHGQDSDRDRDPRRSRPDQPEAQRRLQGETEQVARRLGTMLRFLAYHRLDQGEEQKLLDDAAKTLGGLSKNEMEAVIAHLEAAIKAPDDKTATDEAKKAYDRHRDVVKNLKSLLLKYDTIKTLDQAAERLERGRPRPERTPARRHRLWPSRCATAGPAAAGLVTTATEQADNQGDLNRDLEGLFKQLEKLPPFLTAEQKERLAASKANEKGKKIQDGQTLAGRAPDARTSRRPPPRTSRRRPSCCSNWPTPCGATKDKLETLKEARAKVDKAAAGAGEARWTRPPPRRRGSTPHVAASTPCSGTPATWPRSRPASSSTPRRPATWSRTSPRTRPRR